MALRGLLAGYASYAIHMIWRHSHTSLMRLVTSLNTSHWLRYSTYVAIRDTLLDVTLLLFDARHGQRVGDARRY